MINSTRKIARDRWTDTKFTSESARQGINKKHEKDAEDFSSSLPSASADSNRMQSEFERANSELYQLSPRRQSLNSSQAKNWVTSLVYLVRPSKAIMEHGTPDQMQSMNERSEAGEKTGVRTMYD
jgi:hypothetical protein